MGRSVWYLILLPLVFMTCKSSSAAVQTSVEDDPVVAVEEESTSDSITVSKEVYDHTLTEVKHFVDNLNLIIRTKNYNSWKTALSDKFLARISSPEFLETASESTLLRAQKIVLKTPSDYFTNVVVPSRSNSQVDEIEFTAKGTVKVYYIERKERKDNNGEAVVTVRRLRLYELEKSGDVWKIID